MEIPPVPHQIRGAAWTWSPGDELLSVPLKGDIPHLLSLTLAAGLHGSRQEFGISISSLGEGFASQPETLLKTRPALCKERISLMKQSWNKFIKMKRKCSLSANCMLAGLQLLLSLFHPAEVLLEPVSAPRATVRAWKA